MTDARHRPTQPPPDAARELRDDERVEDRILWKGILALMITGALAYARQRWWV
jgi:hypothetical protein